MKTEELLAQEDLLRSTKPETPDELHAYVKYFWGIDLIRKSMCPNHNSEFDYICHSFFKEEDCIVRANRGGGKTEDGGLLTVLESLFKPGIQTRIIGGSKEQSEKMYLYTEDKWDSPAFRSKLLHPPLKTRTMLRNGSMFSILSQSSKSVRGVRAHRLRCDEVDEFEKRVWKALQFCSKSSGNIQGSMEILSTIHRVDGVMTEVLKKAEEVGTKTFTWCLMDVLEPCGPERKCQECALREDCRGRAKERTQGFYSIRDAIKEKMRTDEELWQVEALSKMPGFSQRIFPPWDPNLHLIDYFYNPAWPVYRGLDFGSTRDPFVCIWYQLDSGGNAYAIDEIYKFNLAPSECVEAVDQHEKLNGYAQAWGSFAEPAGSSYKAEFNKRGMYVTSKMAHIIDGIHLIRARLKLNEKTHKPTFYISLRCPKFISEMESFTPDRLAKGLYDHCISTARYFFLNVPRQIDVDKISKPFRSSRVPKDARFEEKFVPKGIQFKQKLARRDYDGQEKKVSLPRIGKDQSY